MASLSLSLPPEVPPVLEDEIEGDARILEFLRRPAFLGEIPSDPQSLMEKINAYFEICTRNNIQPRITGLALALGLPGVTALRRLALRRTEVSTMISRALTVIGYGYEQQLSSGSSRGAIFALKNLIDFDPEQPVSHQESAPWEDKRSLTVTAEIKGVPRPTLPGSELSPEEVYFRLIRGGDILEGEATEVVQEDDVSPLEKIMEEEQKREPLYPIRLSWKDLG